MGFLIVWLIFGTIAALVTILYQVLWYESLILRDQETAKEFLKYVGLAFFWPFAILWFAYRIIHKAVKG